MHFDRKQSLIQRLAVAGSTVAVLGLLIIIASQDWIQTFTIGNRLAPEGQSEPVPNLGIRLHPEDHVERPSQTLTYYWTISSAQRRPDGVLKRVYLINDEFPGPVIEARSGDTVVVEVNNQVQDEGAAIHWHGLFMRDALSMDGAVGITQSPIAPGQNFTYEFRISEQQHGTYWYHAHDDLQRADGLYGGFVIHQPRPPTKHKHMKTRVNDEQLLLVGDWYHRSATEAMRWYLSPASFGNEPVPDSVLVNGFGSYNCSLAVKARPVDCQYREPNVIRTLSLPETGKTQRIRVVNVGTLAGISLDLDGISGQIVEVDGGNKVNVEPSASIGILYPGERADVLVNWSAQSRRLSVVLDEESFRYPNLALAPSHTFPIGSSTSRPTTLEAPSEPLVPILAKARAAEPVNLPQEADVTMVIYVDNTKLAHLSNVPHAFINHTTWQPQQVPLIDTPRADWDKHQFVPFINSSAEHPKWVEIVINNIDDGSHPFHLHGYAFYVVASHSGGTYKGSHNPFDAPDGPLGGPYNLVDPVRKDTVMVPARGYVAIRFLADNPGIWFFHCHILWHVASGMAMALEVGDGG